MTTKKKTVLVVCILVFLMTAILIGFFMNKKEPNNITKEEVSNKNSVLNTVNSPDGKLSLTLLENKNGNIALEWAVDMLDSNVLVSTGFEESDEMLPEFRTLDSALYVEGVEHRMISVNTNLGKVARSVYASGWQPLSYFTSGGETTPSYSAEENEKYTRYVVYKDGTYTLAHYQRTNGQFTYNTDSQWVYTENQSLKVGDTFNTLLGNQWSYPNYQANQSRMTFPRTYEVPNGTNLSFSFRAKTEGTATFTPSAYGGMSSYTYPFHTTYGMSKPITVSKTALAGDNTIYVNNIDQLSTSATYYITNMTSQVKDSMPLHEYLQVIEVNKSKGYIKIKGALTQDFEVGYELNTHVNRTPLIFPSRTLEASQDWQLYNLNALVRSYEDYNTLVQGMEFWVSLISNGNTYLDDFKFGYATKVRIDRTNPNGTTTKGVYKGLLSDFTDKNASDIEPPKPPTTGDVKRGNDSLYVELNGAKDEGSTYTYTLNTLNYLDEIESTLSHSKKLTSGIKGYSYVLSTNENATVDNTVDTTMPTFNIKVEDNKQYYILVRTVDNNGNVSDVYSIPYKDDTKPTLMLSEINNTHENVEIEAQALDNEGYIVSMENSIGTVIPNPKKDYMQKITEVIEANGTYAFSATDSAGNKVTENINITSINEAPILKSHLIDFSGERKNNEFAFYSNNDGHNKLNYQVDIDDYNMSRNTDGENLTLYATVRNNNNEILSEYNNVEIKQWSSQKSKIEGFNGALDIPTTWDEGEYTLEFKVTDNYVESNSITMKFIIDKTPPKVSIEVGHGESPYSANISISNSNSDVSGINYNSAKLNYVINGKNKDTIDYDAKKPSDIITVKDLISSSLYTFNLSITDNVGNEGVSSNENYLTEVKLTMEKPYFVEPETTTINLKWETELNTANKITTNISRNRHLIAILDKGNSYNDKGLEYEREYVYSFTNYYGDLSSKTVNTKDVGMTIITGVPRLLIDIPDAEKTGKDSYIVGKSVFEDYYILKPYILYKQGGKVNISTVKTNELTKENALIDKNLNESIWNYGANLNPYTTTTLAFKFINDEKTPYYTFKGAIEGTGTAGESIIKYKVENKPPTIETLNYSTICGKFKNTFSDMCK